MQGVCLRSRVLALHTLGPGFNQCKVNVLKKNISLCAPILFPRKLICIPIQFCINYTIIYIIV
jgi:hypothetical protein